MNTIDNKLSSGEISDTTTAEHGIRALCQRMQMHWEASLAITQHLERAHRIMISHGLNLHKDPATLISFENVQVPSIIPFFGQEVSELRRTEEGLVQALNKLRELGSCGFNNVAKTYGLYVMSVLSFAQMLSDRIYVPVNEACEDLCAEESETGSCAYNRIIYLAKDTDAKVETPTMNAESNFLNIGSVENSMRVLINTLLIISSNIDRANSVLFEPAKPDTGSSEDGMTPVSLLGPVFESVSELDSFLLSTCSKAANFAHNLSFLQAELDSMHVPHDAVVPSSETKLASKAKKSK